LPTARQPTGASAPVSALTRAWQATLALRALLGFDVTDGKLLIETNGETSRVVLARDPH
jgi:hypothetical protein